MRTRFIHRLCGGLALSLGLASTLAAAEPLVPIVDPAGAARAVLLTTDAGSHSISRTGQFTDEARLVWVRTLGWLNAATTPAAVSAERRGVVTNCPLAGSVIALLPKAGKRVLRVTWTGCTFLNASRRTRFDGSGEVVLPDNTFAPEYVGALHLGTLGDKFHATSTDETYPGYVNDVTYDLHISGRVPLTRFRNVGIFTGTFDMTIDGAVDADYTSPTDDPANPVIVSHQFLHADDYRVVGSTVHTEQDTVLTEDFTVRHGTVRNIGGGTYIPPEETWPSFTGEDFHVRRVLRARDATETYTIEGRMRQRVSPYGIDCADGWYSFRTLEPIRKYNVFRYDGRDAGSVVLNGATIVYSLTDQPVELPYPDYVVGPGERAAKVTVDLGPAGTFEHASYFLGITLPPLGSCPAP